MNRYLYVQDNPVNLVDPLGLYIAEDQINWWLTDSVLPGPYGQPISEWGPNGPTGWGDPVGQTDKAGGCWAGAENAALGVAWGAVDVAVGAGAFKAAGYSAKLAVHGPHHPFPFIGEWAHLQLNIWKAGVRNSGKTLFRIPLPWK